MNDIFTKKNKIVLSDYPYQKDIENRVLMSELTLFEVDVLQEILDSSIKFLVSDLSEYFDVSDEEIIPILDKFSSIGLLQRSGKVINVDKEMRRYYEFQILKFNDNFEPDIEFLQGLLSKVPIHILPTWYSIPRTSDNIIHSIINSYLLTPKIYERYLSELTFDLPVMKKIMKDVFESKDLKVSAQELIKKYKLSREEFEELMLLLEYNFVCCLGYNKRDDLWEEVVTPFHEWRSYLKFIKESAPEAIKDEKRIQKHSDIDFSFVKDLSHLLEGVMTGHISVQQNKNKEWSLSKTDAQLLFPQYKKPEVISETLINKLLGLDLVEISQNQLKPLKPAKEWLKKDLKEKAIQIHRLNLHNLRFMDDSPFAEKDLREIQKSLIRVAKSGWITLNDFLKGFITPLGNGDQIILENKGKRWKYALPVLSVDNKQLIENTIANELYQAGLVAIGTYNGEFCFCVTPFGASIA